MSQDDPFASLGDDDKTILRPMPGGRMRGAPPFQTPPPAREPEGPSEAREPPALGDNPLIAGARSLLSLVARLRNTPFHPAIPKLQQQVVGELRRFENHALQRGIPEEQVRIASYALCSLIDETVLNTPWGAQSFWAHQSLLVIFHKEAWGGERFFATLDRLVRQPAQNLYLIELCWLCLSLGFQGKYRIAPNGLNTLEQVRGELYQLIRRVRGDFERELSPRWQGLKDVRNALVRYVPLWVVAAAAGALLVLTYLGFAFALNAASDPVARDLFTMAKDQPKAPPETPFPAPQSPPRAERFKPLLAQEISQGLVEVVDDRILRIRNAFPSGSDRVKPEFAPLLAKIARELGTGGDAVLVTGHTDNQPIFSARFPSNFDLSNARAKHVAEILLSSAPLGGRVRYEGRADYEPLAPNDSAENRALNRRVDILVQ